MQSILTAVLVTFAIIFLIAITATCLWHKYKYGGWVDVFNDEYVNPKEEAYMTNDDSLGQFIKDLLKATPVLIVVATGATILYVHDGIRRLFRRRPTW